ncbi:MAG TPA: alpha/beta hydrolase-fold protein [Bacilli bacterium]|nr:MAG: enterobactin/ferric enterobactin esterase [Tenericutes bacterium ADurb.BinA124]HOH18230.1 alpha/beta hydrolase-fold protein [Bacilli bacterium]HPX83824.1 alpha/beta hydrolase-fold protein [Bacilli bacterium]HQC74691.1 alpha/beta hydrolase-fold protein [Bacilli bacterium]
MSKLDYFQVSIDTLNRKRTIRVYLPPGYFQSANKYDVLYMHDGHNLFQVETSAYGKIWDVKNTLDAIKHKDYRGLIVVGIDCDPQFRLNEYSPWLMEASLFRRKLALGNNLGGEGEQYVAWLVNKLIPLIKQKYRTTGINYLAGSSMGALITLYAGLRYPFIFSKVGCFSSAFWFARKQLTAFIKKTPPTNLHIYLDVGSKETKSILQNYYYVHGSQVINRLLKKQGFKNTQLLIEKGGNHSEEAWARRFPGFIEWLLQR